MSSKSSVLAIIAGLACLHGASSLSEQEHTVVSLDARGALAEDRRVLLRREGREQAADEAARGQVTPQASFCSNGGTSTPGSALEFSPGIPAPRKTPFTLALRVKFHGGIPQSPGGSLPLIMWTVDKDTRPSGSTNQFYKGRDHEPPRIALTREGNALMYEEYGKQGANTFISNPTKLLNDGEYHDIVLVREKYKISLWVDNEDNEQIGFRQHGVNFATEALPQSSPASIYGQNGSSENKYFKKQSTDIADFGRVDIMNGRWAFDGEVLNVRLYKERALHSHDFPDSSSPCEPLVQCDASCAECNATGPSSCTRCEGIRHLHAGRCEFTCPRGFYIDASANECKKCSDNCGGCSGPTQCTSCDDNKLLTDGSCGDSCPDNTFQNENGECQDIVGSVITLSRAWDGQELVLEAQGDWCLGVSAANTTAEHARPAQHWIVASAGNNSIALRNVLTGKFLDMPSDAQRPGNCSNTLAQCLSASPTPMENADWALRSCNASRFQFKFVSLENHYALRNTAISRFLQISSGVLDRSENDAASVSATGDSDRKRRFEVTIVHSPFKAEIKYAGRCTMPVNSMMACRQAAASTEMLTYADFQEVDDATQPPYCSFYEDTIEPSGDDQDPQYTDYPRTIQRLRFNSPSHADQAGHLPPCSGERICLCIENVDELPPDQTQTV